MDVRHELARLMQATVDDHDRWVYRAVRPTPVPLTWHPGQRVVGDCSKGVQFLCRWSGGPDPMKNGWSDIGNSATLAVSLEHLLTPAALRVGDIVTFGADGTSHAAMVFERGVDPKLWSFGHPGAPNFYLLSQDHRTHQLLRLPVIEDVSPEEKLRARTGWFAWAAWQLGEGDWMRYGPGVKRVRPNVPHLVPGPGTTTWWPRLVRFKAARRKGNKPSRALSGYMK